MNIFSRNGRLFSPYHFIHDAYIALDDFHDFGRDVFIYIVGNGDSMVTFLAEADCGIYCLKETLLIDAGNDEIGFVDGFGTFGRGADANGGEGVTYAGEKTALFGECAAIANHGKSVHLKTVVIVET